MAKQTKPEEENLNMPPPRSVNIRNVPYEIWERARLNAIRSRMSFQEYCTLLLMESEVFDLTDTA